MTRNEKKLAAQMLSHLADILSNRSCNEFDFPDQWSWKEKRNFVKEFYYCNKEPEEFNEECLELADFCVVHLLQYKLNKEANR